jgi:Leucine-rich repeat (LRR) protein
MAGLLWLLGGVLIVSAARAQCPWDHHTSDLQSSCICAYNLGQQLSVQCDMVDFPQLIKAMDKFGRTVPIDLLYVNNSTVKSIGNNAFKNLRLTNLQLSGCRIRTISPSAFEGLQSTLKNLYLQDNELEDVPVESIRILRNLTSLDLSKNRITRVPDNAFVTLNNLATLKLSDNNLTIGEEAFNGLENSLKNLNLKGAKQKRIPAAVRGLRTLAFLDMAQNGLRELPGPAGAYVFEGLDSLTALNLERNVIQTVGESTFLPVKETLSSLSLLNNLLTDFPTDAIKVLSELRVSLMSTL